MLDLLLLRAEQASKTLYARATVMPNPYELRRIKQGDEFCELMLDAIYCIRDRDGPTTLQSRHSDIVAFGNLLAFVLWQLNQWQLTWEEYFTLLIDKGGYR